MSKFKRVLYILTVVMVATVLMLSTFIPASAEEESSSGISVETSTRSMPSLVGTIDQYEFRGPADDVHYYFVVEFSDRYYVVYLNDDYVLGLKNNNMIPSFNYNYIIGSGHYFYLSNIISYNAYVYKVPKSFLETYNAIYNGAFSTFYPLNDIILGYLWDDSRVSPYVTYSEHSSSTNPLHFDYSFGGGSELTYNSSTGVISFNFPPIVAGNISISYPGAIIYNTSSSSLSCSAYSITYNKDTLYDIFKLSASYDYAIHYGYYDRYDVGYAEGSSDGYDLGYSEGVSLAQYGLFASAQATSFSWNDCTLEFPSDSLKLDMISYGISFRSIASTVEHILYSNDLEPTQETRFLVTVEFDIPFLFSRNLIYVSQSLGFYDLIFYDVSGKAYSITDSTSDNEITDYGYPLIASDGFDSVYGKHINKIVVEFANPDYVGSFIAPFDAVFQSGYLEGYNQGLDVGFSKGESKGYSDGFAKGRQYSIDEYASDSTGWNVITGAFSSILSVMDINVFGYFSLGDVVSVVLVFGVVFFVFKLIRG